MHCHYCGSNLHTIKHCPKSMGGVIPTNVLKNCTFCGGTDHETAACPNTESVHPARPVIEEKAA